MGKQKVKGSQITRQQNFQHYIMQFTKPTIFIYIDTEKATFSTKKNSNNSKWNKKITGNNRNYNNCRNNILAVETIIAANSSKITIRRNDNNCSNNSLALATTIPTRVSKIINIAAAVKQKRRKL